MINGGPGLQIPSSSCCQCASDRPPFKVASAITAHTLHLFLSKAREGGGGGISGGCLSPDHNIKSQRHSVELDWNLPPKHISQRKREFYSEMFYSSVTFKSAFLRKPYQKTSVRQMSSAC